MRPTLFLPLLTATSFALVTAPALAHPALLRSDPAAGGTAKPPAVVSLWFSEKIEPVFNKLEIIDARGVHFEDGKASVAADDSKRLDVRVKPLPAGRYRVHWRASAADTHKIEGSFAFQVQP
ncbi:MAG: copper resistance protein CopC [Rhodoblastus sp.]|nr:copper resistance protein CopC [Rhodoblastus sp.]